MVVLAREARALTQAALADTAGLAQGTVSKIEHGLIEISEESVERLSKALGFPPSFFYQQDPVYGSETPCLHHRKRKTMPVLRLRQVHALVNMMRMQTARLLGEIEIEAPLRLQRMDPAEYESVDQVAQLVRASWRLPLGPVKNMMQSIEAAGGVVVTSNFGTDKLDAISQWDPQQPPFFFVNSEAPGDRLRWNLAHELGHIVMHDMPSPDQEREADRFAAEFLMPGHEIRGSLSQLTLPKLAELKRYWRVSMQALIMRAAALGTISERQKRSLFTRLSQLGYRKREPVAIPREEPTTLRKVIELHRHQHGYSVDELSRVTNLSEVEFRSIYQTDEAPRLRLVPPTGEALMTKANDTDRYVVPNKERGGWDVVKEDHRRASAHEDTKKDAVDRGREIVDNLGGGDLRIANKDGKFADSDTQSGPKHRESKAPDRK